MKQSDYLTILKLTKTALSEYINWGENEVLKSAFSKREESHLAVQSATNIEANSRKIKSSQLQQSQKDITALPEQEETILKDNPNKEQELEKLRQKLDSCKNCSLGESRLNCVFGQGSARADLMFIGEGPGFDEDHKGIPFIGRAGQLLTKIIEAMGFKREEVYIANIVKCHPMKDPSQPESRGNDRPPSIVEITACKNYLDMQINIINPKVLIALGASALKGLFPDEERTISNLRGQWLKYKEIALMPTYHPAALLRNPDLKKPVWQDMKLVMSFLKGNIR